MKRARDIVNLRQGPRDWYKIRNLASGGADVMIYDEIGYFGITAADFVADLAGISGDVTLRLNSPGGEVFEGLAIYHALKARSGSVSVFIDGIAASIASVIAMAASPGKLMIAKRAEMMIHDGLTMAVGNAAEMRQCADQLDEQSDNIAGIYADRTGKPQTFWRDQMKTETFYIGQAAVDAGLADGISGEGGPTNMWELSLFRNADGNHAPMTGTHAHSHPAYGSQGTDASHSHDHTHDGDANHGHQHDAAAMADHLCAFGHPVLNADAPEQLGSGWVRDPDGAVRFDPDGDGDDDSTPEGDTDGDYWGPDGEQLKEIPPCPVANRMHGRFLNGDVDNSPWDAAKAWHNGATADDPAAFYKGICAGRKAGDADKQSSWALPYKYTPSSPPNAAGVRNALSRLSQTDGLTNESDARATLERLMKEINPDYDPSDEFDAHSLVSLLSSALEGV